MSDISTIEREFFRALNALAEPLVRAGFGSPAVCPTGLIVLETTGRRSGRSYSTPLLAMEIGDHLLVTTARGGRSDWMKNIRNNRNVRYWLRGEAHDATALAFAPAGGQPELDTDGLPEPVRSILASVCPVACGLGIAFGVLVPKLRA